MNDNVKRIGFLGIAMIAWNIVYNLVMSAFHAKYGVVQMDTGQLALWYKNITEYISYVPVITNLVFICAIGFYIYKFIKNNDND